MRNIIRIAAFAALVGASTHPLHAQGGRGNPPPRRDSTTARQTPDGTILEFVNQDVSVVLRAIAEAGNLPITLVNSPPVSVTLRVQAQMTKEAALEMLKAVAEINNITVTESPSIIRLVGPPKPPPVQTTPTLSAQQQALLSQQARVPVINMIRLKNLVASEVQPVLMSLFTGTGGVGNFAGAGGRANALGGVQGQLGGVGGAAANNAGGGRGGRGGGGGGGGAGGAGGAGRGGAAGNPNVVFGGGGAGGGVAQALQQAFGGALGGVNTVRPFSDMRIVPEASTNSLLVMSTQEDFLVLQQLITGIDVRPLQVLIEVTIAQVQRTHDLDVGLSGSAVKNKGTSTDVVKTTTGTSTTPGTLDTRTTTTTRSDTGTIGLLPSAATARDFIAQLTGGKGAVNYTLALNALQTRGDVRVLSLPVIIAQNNKQAVINVGSSVPFVQVSQTVPNDPSGRVQTVQYQNVGTSLTILPSINTDGYVNLQIQQTNDDVTNNILFDAPIINNRQATTQVFIRDGQTTVLGGLADNTDNNSTSGIPFLSRIPFIGSWLFGNTTHHHDATELYLFLTPHIISSDEDIDRLRNAVKSTTELLKDVKLHSINPGGDTINIGTVRKPAPVDTTKPRRPPPADSSNTPRFEPTLHHTPSPLRKEERR